MPENNHSPYWPPLRLIEERLSQIEPEPLPDDSADPSMPADNNPAVVKLSPLVLARLAQIDASADFGRIRATSGAIVLLHIAPYRPFPVLLNAPIGMDGKGEKETWSGWICSPDLAYASDSDVALEPEDEPFDPAAAMVQLWNPVTVKVRGNLRVLAQLSSHRLAAIRQLAKERQTCQSASSKTKDRSGLRLLPLMTGGSVLSGPEIRDGDDLRHRYQLLYRDFSRTLGLLVGHAAFGKVGSRGEAANHSWRVTVGMAAVLVLSVSLLYLGQAPESPSQSTELAKLSPEVAPSRQEVPPTLPADVPKSIEAASSSKQSVTPTEGSKAQSEPMQLAVLEPLNQLPPGMEASPETYIRGGVAPEGPHYYRVLLKDPGQLSQAVSWLNEHAYINRVLDAKQGALLVVEDNAEQRAELEKALQQSGFFKARAIRKKHE